MIKSVQKFCIGVLAFFAYSLVLVLCSIPFYFLAILKFLSFDSGLRKFFDKSLVWIAELYINGNKTWMGLLHRTQWQISGLEGLSKNHWYLISCNHQTWTDIFVLQSIFNKRIPFLKFYIKQELIWVPLVGTACWALNFPFMKRYSKEYLEKHPEKKEIDMQSARKALRTFLNTPTTVINFPEGTRFTSKKHKEQKSPYQNLLKPKAGGLAYAIQDLGNQFDKVLDVTIVYPDGPVGFFKFLCGQLHTVHVDIKQRPVESWLLNRNYKEDPEFKETMRNWVNDLWHDKDVLITQKQMKIESEKQAASPPP